MEISDIGEIPYYWCYYDTVYYGDYQITLRIKKVDKDGRVITKGEDVLDIL